MIKLPSYHVQSPMDGCLIVNCSNGEGICSADYHEILRFLVHEPAGVPKDLPRVVWNLAELVGFVKAVIPHPYLVELEGDKHRADWYEGETHYRLFHQPGKFFGIHCGRYGDETTFFELDQFYPSDPAVDGIADVKKLSDGLVEAFASLGVQKLTNLSSPVRAIEESGLLEQVYKSLPDPSAIPSGCLEFATMTDSWGAWCSAYQVGYWPDAYEADIASCYPSIAARLVSLDGARYEFSKTMLNNAYYGFVKGVLHINPAHKFAYCSPVVFPIDDYLGNPVGDLKGYFTLGQVRFMERNGIGEFTISKREGGWFVFPKDGTRPLDAVMRRYYEARNGNELVNMIAKRIVAGIIGRLGEFRKNQPTENTNPVYHGIIRNGASLLVAQDIIQRDITPDELICVNTDGYHTTRDLGLPDKAAMGGWKGGKCELMVLSPSVVLEDDKCAPLLSAIKADKKSTVYGDEDEFNMLKLAGEQNRYFKTFPRTGGELLRRHYQSEAIVL